MTVDGGLQHGLIHGHFLDVSIGPVCDVIAPDRLGAIRRGPVNRARGTMCVLQR